MSWVVSLGYLFVKKNKKQKKTTPSCPTFWDPLWFGRLWSVSQLGHTKVSNAVSTKYTETVEEETKCILSIPCVRAHMRECVHACKRVHVFICFPTMPQVGRDKRMLLECVKKMLIAALRKRGRALLGRNHSVLVSADTLMYMDTVAADRPILC